MQTRNMPTRKSREIIDSYIKYGSQFHENVIKPMRQAVRTGKESLPSIYKTLCHKWLVNTDIKWEYCFQRQLDSLGQEYPFPICISVNDSVAHGYTRIPHIGDIVSIDCGIRLLVCNDFEGIPINNTLNFDVAFTEVFGRERPKEQDWILAPQKALEAIIEAQPKDTMQLAQIIQTTAKEHKLQQVVSLTGHGIGTKLHEPPIVYNRPGPFSPLELYEGIVFCTEPIYVMPRDQNKFNPIASTYLESNEWEVITVDGQPATHFETMFAIVDGRLIDLIGMSSWDYH